MVDMEKVIKGLEIQLEDLQKYADSDEMLTLTQEQAKEIVALLKEQQDEIYALRVELASSNELAEGYAELLKEREAVKVQYTAMGGLRYGACPQCDARIDNLVNPKACGFCGKELKWE